MENKILDKIDSSDQELINLGNLGITDNQIEEIVNEIIKKRPKVSEFNLDNNKIGNSGAAILGEKLEVLTNLSKISLQFNQIDIKGADSLFKLKKTHPKLIIALHGNLIIDVAEMAEIEDKYDSTVKK